MCTGAGRGAAKDSCAAKGMGLVIMGDEMFGSPTDEVDGGGVLCSTLILYRDGLWKRPCELGEDGS